MQCRYFDTTRKGNHSATLNDTNRNLRSKWPTPFEKRQFCQISTYNISTVRDSDKSSIMTNIKSTTAFQQAIDGVRTLPLSPERVAQKTIVSFFRININFNRIKSATKFLCLKTSSSKIVVWPFPYLTVHKCYREQ